MSPRFVLGRENVPCVAEVVNRSLKADCTDFMISPNSERTRDPIGLTRIASLRIKACDSGNQVVL